MDKSISIILCIVLFITTLLVDPLAHHSFTAPKHHFFIIIISVVAAFVFWHLNKINLSILCGIFLLRIIWLSATNAEWVLHPGSDGFLLFISLLLVIFVTTQLKTVNLAPYFFSTVFIIGILQVVVGLWQIHIYIPNPSVPLKTPFLGIIGSSNGVGILLALATISGLYLLLHSKGVKKGFVIIGLLMVGYGLFLSESRGAVLALCIALSAMLLIGVKSFNTTLAVYLRQKRKAVLLIIIPILIVGSLGLWQINPASSSGRLMIWDITLNMIEEKPLAGLGQGNFSVEYLNYQATYFEDPEHQHVIHKAANIKQAHNEFLQAFAEGGLPGGLFLIALWTLPLFYAVRKLQLEQTTKYTLLASVGIHTAILTHALVDSPLHIFPVAVIGYMNMAMMFPLGYEFKVNRRWKLFIGTIIFLYFLFVIHRSFQKYPGFREWKSGIDLVEKQQWEAAINNYQKALARFDKKGELEYNLGSALIFDGQFTKGLYYLNQAKADFNDRNIYLSESYGFIQLEEFEKAKQSALKASSMFPDHLAPHLLLGEIYYELGMVEKSKESLQRCINMETSIISPEVIQIRNDAQLFWRKTFGKID